MFRPAAFGSTARIRPTRRAFSGCSFFLQQPSTAPASRPATSSAGTVTFPGKLYRTSTVHCRFATASSLPRHSPRLRWHLYPVTLATIASTASLPKSTYACKAFTLFSIVLLKNIFLIESARWPHGGFFLTRSQCTVARLFSPPHIASISPSGGHSPPHSNMSRLFLSHHQLIIHALGDNPGPRCLRTASIAAE